DLGADLSLCPGETVTLSITEPEVEILWNDQSTGDQFVVDAEGLVYATISNACGSSSDTVVVELLPDVPALDLGADQSLCPGETITIDPGIADVEYLWQDGSDASNYQTNVPGLIILTISNACGASTDSVIVIEDTNGPQVDLGPDILACEGDTVVLQSGISGVTYLWQDGTSAPHFIAVQSGMYHLQVSNTCGIDTDTIEVDMRGTIPTPELGADTTLCDGEILILNSDADTETIIEWQDGTNDLTYVVSAAGIYILYESNHCGSAADSIVVGYKSAPLPFDLGEDVVLCLGESIVLNAPVTADILTWQDGSHGTSFIADKDQIYSLVISNDCGEVSDEVDVSFDTQEPLVDLGGDISLCPDETLILDVTQGFAADYLWSTGSTLSTLLISQPDVYTVTVSTECYSVEDEISIAEEDCASEIFVPNIFSPNGNNINDEWVVLINDPSIVGVECRIFDRWGDVVYESKEAPIVWDGAFNGKNVLPGVYVYMILLVGSNGETRILSGDITVVQ
ncbi:MAG TPA: gliding motility-associated C-terminal domain-containing protein, partial [Saprospiraceae bacterium]|nr:gliding motility-associated C-terminal domain-containing protein [Saprospiraceae bacterium]